MSKKKFSAGMPVLNGMPWIPYILKNIYPLFDEIVVLEGAVEKAAESATPDGHSVDNTVDAIRNFPDPEKKLKLIQRDGFWSEKTELAIAYTSACTGDYVWLIDSDEFYKAADVRWLQDYLVQHQEIHAVSLTTLNFFGGFRGIMKGARISKGDDQFWRVFRQDQGFRYIEDRPPTMVDEKGIDTRTYGALTGNWLAKNHGIYIYHYSYVFPSQVKQKVNYYHRRSQLTREPMTHLGDWYENHFEHYTPWHVHPDKRPLSWLEPFQGNHPPEIEEMLADIKAERIDVPMRPTQDIDRVLNSWRWRFWRLAGQIDVIMWHGWDGPIRRTLRPLVRLIRARFFGYVYSK